MSTLLDSGLNLRSLRSTDYNELVNNLNYNFQQMLNLSIFRGLKGDEGESVTGASGIRGSIWIFASSTSFIAEYDTIVSSTQITNTFINTQLIEDQPRLMETLDIDELVDMDVILLPSGSVIQFDVDLGEFELTTLTFNQLVTLTENDVITIVNNLINGQSSTNPIDILYTGVAKNASDDQTGMNVDYNNDSILDIPVTGSGSGISMDSYQFLAAKESLITNLNKVSRIIGAASDYHTLAQNTLTNHSVHYMSGIDDFAALPILQNDLKSGILLGYRNATSFRQFSRIYNTGSGLRVTSSYSPLSSEYSDVYITDTDITVRAVRDVILQSESLDLTNVTTIQHNQLLLNDELSSIGDILLPTLIKGSFVKFTTTNETVSKKVVSLDENDFVSTPFDIVDEISDPTPTDVVLKTQIPSHYYLNEVKKALELSISTLSITLDLGVNSGEDDGTNTNLNDLIEFGSIALIKPKTGKSYLNYPFSEMNNISNTDYNRAILQTQNASGEDIDLVNQDVLKQIITQNIIGGVARVAIRFGLANDGAVNYTWTDWVYTNTSIVSGDGISDVINSEGVYSFKHVVRSTSIDANVTHSNGNVIGEMVFDASGHITSITTKNLDDLYHTLSSTSARTELLTEIDWSAAPVRYKTLTANTTLTAINFIINKSITLEITGDYTLTLPSECKKIVGEYDGTVDNLIQFYCSNDSPATVWVTISQETI